MIRSSLVLKGATFVLALGVHSVMAVTLTSDPVVEIESDAGAQTAMLGNSFADMSAGTLAPKEIDAKLEPVKPIETPRAVPEKTQAVSDNPERLEARRADEPLKQVKQTTVEQALEVSRIAPRLETKAATKVFAKPQVSVPIVQTKVATLEPTLAGSIQRPRGAIAQPEANTALVALQPIVKLKPITTFKPAVSTKPNNALKAQDGEANTAVTRSIRPKKRSAKIEKRAVAAMLKPKAGNAKRNAKVGSAGGSKKARAKKQGRQRGKGKRAGNAAASNYPGRVMARISSVGRPSVNARGTAVVRFTINARGGLSSAGIVRSSGSRQLDNAAVQVIHNAIPFLRPPAGARRTFSINIQGR